MTAFISRKKGLFILYVAGIDRIATRICESIKLFAEDRKSQWILSIQKKTPLEICSDFP